MSSVYIHIPFCKKICHYCDFCKVIYQPKWVMFYLDALNKEIKDRYQGEEVDTLYIGGGSPSHLSFEELSYLFDIIKIFNLSDNIEFSFECNINDINDNLLKILKSVGVNRLSIGIESFNKKKLEFMNRECDYEYTKKTMDLCRYYGFDNINLDLIYGIPKESISMLKNDLNKIVSLNPDHISTYSLIIEDNTYISYLGINPIDGDLDYEMYKRICKYLSKNGYIHYEISNFCKKGKESRHNINYWLNNNYYGFGLGAHGYIGNIRYENTRSLTKYNDMNYKLKEELISIDEDMDNYVMLGFRLLKGIKLEDFYNRYKINFQDKYNINELLKEKKLIYSDGYLKINPKYIYVENEILIKML